MTAKEMFKDLDYECEIDDDCIEYHKLNIYGTPYDEIQFDLEWGKIDIFNNRYGYSSISNRLLEAIYQQAKELRWLDGLEYK